jgi:hypothetical protein
MLKKDTCFAPLHGFKDLCEMTIVAALDSRQSFVVRLNSTVTLMHVSALLIKRFFLSAKRVKYLNVMPNSGKVVRNYEGKIAQSAAFHN